MLILLLQNHVSWCFLLLHTYYITNIINLFKHRRPKLKQAHKFSKNKEKPPLQQFCVVDSTLVLVVFINCKPSFLSSAPIQLFKWTQRFFIRLDLIMLDGRRTGLALVACKSRAEKKKMRKSLLNSFCLIPFVPVSECILYFILVTSSFFDDRLTLEHLRVLGYFLRYGLGAFVPVFLK